MPDNNYTPFLSQSTIIEQRNDKFLVLNPEKPDWLVINNSALLLLSLIDNKRTIDEIAKLSDELNCDLNIQEVKDFFLDTEVKCFLSQHQPVKNENTYLKNIHIHLTSKCNFKCNYCYVPNAVKMKEDILAPSAIQSFLKQIVPKFSPNITLTGGEPMLHPNFFEIVDMIHSDFQLGMILLTNGSLITQENISKIVSHISLIQISLDSNNQKINDKLRRKGAYETVKNAVELLQKSKANYKIACTVSKLNIESLKGLVETFGNRVLFQPLYRLNDVNNFMEEYYIEGFEYYSALKAIPNIEVLRDMTGTIARRKNIPCLRCSAGNGSLSIDARGDVYPCHMLHHKEFLSGNIHTDSFESIYFDSESLKRIRQLTVDNIQECSKCAVKYLCGGACRARNYYMNNNLEDCDAFCEYEKNAILDAMFHIE